nr:immunoglobulin heavy chain junction region [Mus musculus]
CATITTVVPGDYW